MAADGVELATRPGQRALALACAFLVGLGLNVLGLIVGFVVDYAIYLPQLAVVLLMSACLPVVGRDLKVARNAPRANRVGLDPQSSRTPVVVEPLFEAEARLRPHLLLRLRGADGVLLGFVRAGRLVAGTNPVTFTVLVGEPEVGAIVALETPDGRRRLLPGSPLTVDGPPVAPWSGRAAEVLGWTASPDATLLAVAWAERTVRQRSRLAVVIALAVLVALAMTSLIYVVVPVAAVAGVALVAAVRVRARRRIEPELARVAPGATAERRHLVEPLVLYGGIPASAVAGPPPPG